MDVILEAMRRDQRVVDDEALAAGAGKAGDMPIVDHRHRALGHQEIPPRRRAF